MNTLFYGSPNYDLIKHIEGINGIKVKFIIGDSQNSKCDIDVSDLIKFNFGPEYKAEISHEAQKFYEKFYNDNFNTFIFQFVRRGLKILDIHEIRNYFVYYYYNFFSIIREKKLDLIIFFSVPHCGVDFILYEISKLINIKIIIMYQTIFPNKYFTIKRVEDLGENLKDLKVIKNEFTDDEIQNFLNHYVKKNNNDLKIHQKKINQVRLNKNFFRELVLKLLIKIGLIYRENELVLNKKYFKNIKKLEVSLSEINKIKKNKKVIFFPLHMQPELTTSILGGVYEDQLVALERLNVFIKKEWIVVVKDHPFQTSYQRNDFFFKRFNNLKNFYFLNTETDTKSIFKIADLVATITGTPGFEALLESKKSIVFGNAWYKNFHGVLHVTKNTSNEEIDSFVNMKYERSKFINDLKLLISSCDNGVIEYDYAELVNNFDHNSNCKQVAENIKRFLNK
jgi:hypothetical protein